MYGLFPIFADHYHLMSEIRQKTNNETSTYILDVVISTRVICDIINQEMKIKMFYKVGRKEQKRRKSTALC